MPGKTELLAPGSTALLRYTDFDRKEVLQALPCLVVRDDPELVALYTPHGTPCMLSRRLDRPGPMMLGPHVIEDARWRRDLLRLMYPGRPFSIWLLWDVAPRRFANWYVNLESPFRRTGPRFDTTDFELDIVIEPDLSFRWKDEDHFAEAIGAGLLARSTAAEIRAVGQRIIDQAIGRFSPFGDGWERWMPDEGMTAPLLPAGWDRLTVSPEGPGGSPGPVRDPR